MISTEGAVERLNQLRACDEGVSRYIRRFAGTFPSLTQVVELIPESDIKFICFWSSDTVMQQIYNYTELSEAAAGNISIKNWVHLLCGQPSLINLAPVHQFNDTQWQYITNKQPSLSR